MKKWHWGGFWGCLIGGVALLFAVRFLVSAFGYYILSSPFTGKEALIIGALLVLLVAVAGLLAGLICQGNCIDELKLKIKQLEEKLEDRPEKE